MYAMLIVEDEFLERQALAEMVRREYPEFNPVWEAGDGEDALRIARAQHPDVLLVDINIPGITGLELCRALAEEGLGGNTIITTAYDRFGYVKQAMDLGCIGYLLKPIRDREFQQAIKKCLDQIEERARGERIHEGLKSVRAYAQPYLIREFLETGIRPEVLRQGYGWPEDGSLTAFYLLWEGEAGWEDAQKALAILEAECERSFRIVASAEAGRVRMFLQAITGSPIRAGVALWLHASVAAKEIGQQLGMCGHFGVVGPTRESGPLNRACQEREGLKSAALVQGQSYLEATPFVGKGTLPPGKRALLRQRIIQRLREGRPEHAQASLERLGQENSYRAAQLLLEALWSYVPGTELTKIWETLPDPPPNAAGLCRWMKEHLGDGNFAREAADAVDTALKILRARYAEPISQAQVAEEVGLSQGYFCRLFKQRTGENFSAALLRIRLERAKELMDLGTERLDQIAIRCGYASTRALDAAFRRAYGISVSQYRRRGS